MSEPIFDPSLEAWIGTMIAPLLEDVTRYLDAVGAPPDLRARMMAEADARGRQEWRAALVRQAERALELDALQRRADDLERQHAALLRQYDDALRRWLHRARPAGQPRWPS